MTVRESRRDAVMVQPHQSRDRLHRLRHLRPALLRAANARGRARRRRRRAARGGHRAVRRADPLESSPPASSPRRACPCSGRASTLPSATSPRTARASASCSPNASAKEGPASTATAHRPGGPRLLGEQVGLSTARAALLHVLGEARDGDRLLAGRARRLPASRAPVRWSSQDATIFLDRFLRERDRGRRRRALRRRGTSGSAEIMQHRRGGRRALLRQRACVLPPHLLRRRDARPDPRRHARHRAAGGRVVGLLERAVRRR